MDLTTKYLGLTLPSPVVASASPLNADLANLRALQALGAGAVVLPSVFEEQIQRDADILEALLDHGAESTGEALSFFPPQIAQSFDTARQLDLVQAASEALEIPVIASLNGVTLSGWIDYAREFEAAGRNWSIETGKLTPEQLAMLGQWRLEVTAAGPPADTAFLHVLQVGDQALETMDAVELLEAESTAGIRVQAGPTLWELTFRKSGDLGGRIRAAGGGADLDRALAATVAPQTGILAGAAD